MKTLGWSVVFAALSILLAAPGRADAAPPSCVTLPSAVASHAAADQRNPRVCPPPPPPTTYLLRTTDAQSATPTWKTSYSANATYELFFALDVTGTISGSHTYSLFIFMPSGFPYQANSVTFDATSCTPVFGSTCSADPITGGIRVWTSIPVAGTLIQQAAIYGTWTADAYIDSATSPNASTAFDIGP